MVTDMDLLRIEVFLGFFVFFWGGGWVGVGFWTSELLTDAPRKILQMIRLPQGR